MDTPTDWRGTPITEGALVIYGAPVGRSIALVEAEVVGFTKSGRVNLRIIRRAYGGGWSDSKKVVHVGADRLIVVNDLPPTTVPTSDEKAAQRDAERAERDRIRATHAFPEPRVVETRPDDWWGRQYVQDPCSKCGADNPNARDLQECPA